MGFLPTRVKRVRIKDCDMHNIDKKYTVIFSLMIGMLSLITFALFIEYGYWIKQVKRLIVVQSHYQIYIQTIQKTLNIHKKKQILSPIVPLKVSDVPLTQADAHTLKNSINSSSPDNKKRILHTSLDRVNPEKKTPKKAPSTFNPGKDIVLAWPIDRSRFWLSSFFGLRKKPNGSTSFHRGIDMAALKGTPVRTAAAGKVVEAHYRLGYGKNILIEHSDGYKTRYAHLNTLNVKTGDQILAGSLIGTVGDTGWVRKSGKDGSHLHFELQKGNKHINPLPFFV